MKVDDNQRHFIESILAQTAPIVMNKDTSKFILDTIQAVEKTADSPLKRACFRLANQAFVVSHILLHLMEMSRSATIYGVARHRDITLASKVSTTEPMKTIFMAYPNHEETISLLWEHFRLPKSTPFLTDHSLPTVRELLAFFMFFEHRETDEQKAIALDLFENPEKALRTFLNLIHIYNLINTLYNEHCLHMETYYTLNDFFVFGTINTPEYNEDHHGVRGGGGGGGGGGAPVRSWVLKLSGRPEPTEEQLAAEFARLKEAEERDTRRRVLQARERFYEDFEEFEEFEEFEDDEEYEFDRDEEDDGAAGGGGGGGAADHTAEAATEVPTRKGWDPRESTEYE